MLDGGGEFEVEDESFVSEEEFNVRKREILS